MLPKHFVLLADDDPINRMVAEELLTKLGCCVESATGGRMVVEMAKAKPYDIIFMDCQMPEMSGYEATALIRRLESQGGTHIPIIAMTASPMQSNPKRCLEAGMDDYISKPVNAAAFQTILHKWVRSNVNP